VVLSPDYRDRYLVIDGHKRIAALQQLGRDTVEATVWAMSAAEALLLDRSLRFSPQESALEQGWVLSEMEQRLGYSLEELARRFDRSVSWVSRRLALVELLPESIQQQVREGAIAAQLAIKYLVPVARVSLEQCAQMAAAFVRHRCDTRQAGQLYAAWRDGSRVVRERILAEPELFLKTQRQPPSARPAAAAVERELEMAVAAILELSAKGVTKREIERVLQLSRPTVRKVLRSNSNQVPEIQRAEKAEPYRQQILDLLVSCKGNLVRVHEELTADGAALSYAAPTAFCRRHGIGYAPPVPAGQYDFAPGV
jgi:hypothetical protein